MRGDKIKAGKRRMARLGFRHGGVIPLGYRRSWDPDQGRSLLSIEPEEAAVVREAFDAYLRLSSLGRACNELNRQRHWTRRGRPWTRAALAFVLGNPTYIGFAGYRGERHRGVHQALVSPSVFNKVQALRRRNRRGPRGFSDGTRSSSARTGADGADSRRGNAGESAGLPGGAGPPTTETGAPAAPPMDRRGAGPPDGGGAAGGPGPVPAG